MVYAIGMFVVEVLPIQKTALKGSLTFFSKEALQVGDVISAPIRGKSTPTLVLSCRDVREEKLSLRNSEYALKKVTGTPKRIFDTRIIEAVREAAVWYGLPEGIVLQHFTPNAILTSTGSIPSVTHDREEHTTTPDRLALQGEYEDRIRTYRNIAREAFARGESVFILTPTIPEAESLFEKLSRGIEEQVLLVTSGLSKKAAIAAWKRAATDPEPLLIIGTHSFLSMPRDNLKTLIIERESARAYRGRERTQIDARIFAEARARGTGTRIIFADFPLRVETRARLKLGTLEESMRLQVASHSSARTFVLDARTKDEVGKTKKKFSPLIEKTMVLIESHIKRQGRVFVYASRRGLAPLTICNDCETPVTDPTTGAPMSLHKTPDGNVFLSHHTGALKPAHTTCASCGSWNLVSLGIGAERVAEELEKRFPNTPLFTLTTDTADTHPKAKRIADEFFGTPGAILVGTERALPYLAEPVELSVVASIDSALSSSAWRAHEYAHQTLFFLRDRSQEEFVVQTRMPDTLVMKSIATGNPTDFFNTELAQREQFGYPPAATFIGLTWIGTERGVNALKEEVLPLLSEWDVVGPLPPRQVGKNRFLMRVVLRLAYGLWPDEKLRATLKNLPPAVSVSVDPDEIV